MSIPSLDKCPGYNLYIGGFIALRRPQALKSANITHIVSVLDWKFDDDTPLTRGYRHLHIPVDDVEDENLLEWFPRSNAFIQQGIDHWKTTGKDVSTHVAKDQTTAEKGSGVLIHCAMGKSRSATILLAYLLWSSRQPQASVSSTTASESADMISLPPKPLSVIEALELLRGGRAIAEPNEGFMDQLHMYEDMRCPTTMAEIIRHKIYRRWMNKRSVEESLRVNQAPEMASIIFEDEADFQDGDVEKIEHYSREAPHANVSSLKQQAKQVKESHMTEVAPGISAPDGTAPVTSSIKIKDVTVSTTTIKCRKCRHTLATTPFILPHVPPPHRDPAAAGSNCGHIFLHPLSWMRSVLSEGQMEGRLTCPNTKCNANIGKFAWSGLRCSCGGWVTPGFGVTRGKVDEVSGRGASGESIDDRKGNMSTLRMPPGTGRGNL